MAVNLHVAGISHNGMCADEMAPYCLNAEQVLQAARIARQKNPQSEFVILSTCNRVEFYAAAESAQETDELALCALSLGERDMSAFLQNRYLKSGLEAAEHLFKVASGLDSQMTGETEIFGQIKGAFAAAAEFGSVGSVLNAAFQKAMQAAKWVRTNTEIGRGKISIGSVASELAVRIFESLKSVKILLIGSGEAGRLVAEALNLRGAKDITVSNRTWERAYDLSMKVEASAMPFELALGRLGRFDIVICATSAQEPFVKKGALENSLTERQGKAQFIIDLSVPRNVEEACAQIEDVFLYRLEDLSNIANENLRLRKADMDVANAEISRKALLLCEKLGLK